MESKMAFDFWEAFNDEITKVGVASMVMANGKVKNGTKDDNKKLDTNETMDAKTKGGKKKSGEAPGFLEKKLMIKSAAKSKYRKDPHLRQKQQTLGAIIGAGLGLTASRHMGFGNLGKTIGAALGAGTGSRYAANRFDRIKAS